MICDGRKTLARVTNTGRLGELLIPENAMLLAPAPAGTRRKTAYDLVLVDVDGLLVSVDARLPNTLLREAIESHRLTAFSGYSHVADEVVFLDSRIGLVLSGDQGSCYLEAKSVTLVENGTALFPDAPTLRGRKHLGTLVEAAKQGHRAAVAFVIQRSDASAFLPKEEADPEFCGMLRAADRHGVEVHAFGCRVTRRKVEIANAVPVSLA